MAFKVGSSLNSDKASSTSDGIPYLWGTGDTTTGISNENKITASDQDTDDFFGQSVAVGFNKIVVGAWRNDGSYPDTHGAIYIYDLDGTNEIKITNGISEQLGISVAIGSGRIVAGARKNNSGVGKAYIYDLEGNELHTLLPYYTLGPPEFGSAVAIGHNKVVVGCRNDSFNISAGIGCFYIFNALTGQRDESIGNNGRIGPPDSNFDQFGSAVAIGCGIIVIGDFTNDTQQTNAGAIAIYDLNGNHKSTIYASDPGASDHFGQSVAVGSGRIVVGAPGDNPSDQGAAYILDLEGNELKKLTAPDAAALSNFGTSVAIGSGRIVVGSPFQSTLGRGSIYIFDLEGNFIAKKVPDSYPTPNSYSTPYARFGQSVAIDSSAGKVVAGASSEDADESGDDREGAAYIYDTPNVYTLYDAIELNRGYK